MRKKWDMSTRPGGRVAVWPKLISADVYDGGRSRKIFPWNLATNINIFKVQGFLLGPLHVYVSKF